jgi:AcrR family transcriptional regulator
VPKVETIRLENKSVGLGGDALHQQGIEVARRIAERSAAQRVDDYSDEVERLLVAGLAEMARLGTSGSPSVAAVVAAAGLSKDALYRHFSSKDDFVAAIVDVGTAQLSDRLSREMAGVEDPSAKIRAWVEGVMRQAMTPEVAEIVRVVVWNARRVGDDTRRRGAGREQLAVLLEAPVAELGSSDARRDALLVSYACMMRMEEFLWRREFPTDDDVEQVVAFVLRAISGRA